MGIPKQSVAYIPLIKSLAPDFSYVSQSRPCMIILPYFRMRLIAVFHAILAQLRTAITELAWWRRKQTGLKCIYAVFLPSRLPLLPPKIHDMWQQISWQIRVLVTTIRNRHPFQCYVNLHRALHLTFRLKWTSFRNWMQIMACTVKWDNAIIWSSDIYYCMSGRPTLQFP